MNAAEVQASNKRHRIRITFRLSPLRDVLAECVERVGALAVTVGQVRR